MPGEVGTRLERTVASAGRHAPPAPVPPPGSHPAPLPPHEPPPVQQPAPLPPPQSPPRLGAEEELDDENWAPNHLPTSTTTAFATAATARAESPKRPPPNPPDDTAPANAVRPCKASGERPGDAAFRLHCTPFPTQPTPMVSRCVNRGRQRKAPAVDFFCLASGGYKSTKPAVARSR